LVEDGGIEPQAVFQTPTAFETVLHPV